MLMPVLIFMKLERYKLKIFKVLTSKHLIQWYYGNGEEIPPSHWFSPTVFTTPVEPVMQEFVQVHKDVLHPTEWYFTTQSNEYQALMNLRARDLEFNPCLTNVIFIHF